VGADDWAVVGRVDIRELFGRGRLLSIVPVLHKPRQVNWRGIGKIGDRIESPMKPPSAAASFLNSSTALSSREIAPQLVYDAFKV
jgi:hypothetical protein